MHRLMRHILSILTTTVMESLISKLCRIWLVIQGCTVRLHEMQSTVAMTSMLRIELSTFYYTLSAC